jgi:RNA polymerase sigma-70 factor (ECF subfamily)
VNETSAQAAEEPRIAADLVARIGRGDREAEAELCRRYSRGLLFLLRQRTGDTELAQDLRQDTFRIAIEKLRASGLDDSERLAAWLRGIALNLVTGDWRKRDRRKTTADTDALAEMPTPDKYANPEAELGRAQLADALRRAIARMAVERDRAILMQYYVDERDKDEICAALDISSLHFNRVLYRAKERLRKILIEEERRGLFEAVK